jgi:hypothetical protein
VFVVFVLEDVRELDCCAQMTKDHKIRLKKQKEDIKPDAGVEPATLRLDQSPLLEGET